MDTKVAILMGSDSDWPVMKEAAQALKELGVEYEARVLSAHRTPEEASEFAQTAMDRGIRVIIAGAGMAAHLAGAMAAKTPLPIIGVPIASGPLQGQDALLSTVQMPKGMPVATVAISNAWNAGILATQMLGCGQEDPEQGWIGKVRAYRSAMKEKVLAKELPPL